MNKTVFTSTDKIERADFLSAILSNLTVIIQIVALGIIGLSNVLSLKSIFQLSELVNVANFIILFLSFSLISLYSFFKANKDLYFAQPAKKGVIHQINEKLFGTNISNPLGRSGEKKFLLLLFITTCLSTSLFFYSTFQVVTLSLQNSQTIAGFIQILTYSISLICGSVIIFIWIRDQIDKMSLFTEEKFIPNLRNTLIDYEIVETPKIQILQNLSITNGNHLIKVKVDTNEKYLITNFDGKRIFGEISKNEYEAFINPPQNVQN